MLIIEDGGPNDLDGIANGSIEDANVLFSVQATDAEDDELSYTWARVSGPTLILNVVSSNQLVFTTSRC